MKRFLVATGRGYRRDVISVGTFLDLQVFMYLDCLKVADVHAALIRMVVVKRPLDEDAA